MAANKKAIKHKVKFAIDSKCEWFSMFDFRNFQVYRKDKMLRYALNLSVFGLIVDNLKAT